MAPRYLALFICVIFCLSYVRGEDLKPEVETSQDEVNKHVLATSPLCTDQLICPRLGIDLTQVTAEVLIPKIKDIEECLIKSKEAVDLMLNRSLTSQQEDLHIHVMFKSDLLARHLKRTATRFAEVVSVGEHTTELKDAVLAAVPVLNEAAASLKQDGDALKQKNTKYYEAANKLLHEVQKILDVEPEPSDKVLLALKMPIFKLQRDISNYQKGIYNQMEFYKDDQ